MQGPKWPLFYSYIDHVWSLLIIGTGYTLGRAPRTKETLPNFREWCRVTDYCPKSAILNPIFNRF